MSIEQIEAEALKLDPKSRARLAEKLLESLEQLSEEESDRLWTEEALRRDADWDGAHQNKWQWQSVERALRDTGISSPILDVLSRNGEMECTRHPGADAEPTADPCSRG